MMQLCHSLESLGCFHCDPWMLVCDLPYVCGQLNTWWTIFIYQQEGSLGIKNKHNFYVQQTAQQKCNKGYEEMYVAEHSEGATLPDSWHPQEWLQVHLIVWDMAFLWWEMITTVVSLNTNTLLHSFDQQSKSSCWQSCTPYGSSRRGSLLLAFWAPRHCWVLAYRPLSSIVPGSSTIWTNLSSSTPAPRVTPLSLSFGLLPSL